MMRTLNNKGMSLIELLVAVAIVTISGTTLFYGFVAAAKTSARTSQRQMAQDGTQKLIEEFQSYTVRELEEKYTGLYTKEWVLDSAGNKVINGKEDTDIYNITSPDNIVDDMYEYKFDNIVYTYSPRGEQAGSSYVATIELSPLTATDLTDPTIKKELDTALSSENKNTYKQRGVESNKYAVNPLTNVGTNTFILPDVTNLYDGKSFVLSEELSEYDSSVVSNLYSAIYSALQEVNNTLKAASPTAPVILLDQFDSDFSARYIPLSNMNGSAAKLEKTTEFYLADDFSGGKYNYQYIIQLSYEFSFDFNLVLSNGIITTTAPLSSVLGTTIPTAIDGADTTYTIKRSGTKYTVEYKQEIADISKYGTSGGVIELEDKDGNPVTDFAISELPRIYLLYKPFDVFSDTKSDGKYIASDKIRFVANCGPYTGGNATVPSVFFVAQETKHAIDTNTDVVLRDLEMESQLRNDASLSNPKYPGNTNLSYDEEHIKVFTNCLPAIEKNADFGPKNYLTNSIGEFSTNFYKMTISLKTLDGVEVTNIVTIKED